MPNFTVRVMLSPGLILQRYRTATEQASGLPQVYDEVDGTFLVWQQQDVVAGSRYEYEIEALVESTKWDVTLDSRARVVTHKVDQGPAMVEESLSLLVKAKGSYLQFLPALYDQDELMGRFLMLFE
nr:hypothetical protein [Ardenticatenales bacterium]